MRRPTLYHKVCVINTRTLFIAYFNETGLLDYFSSRNVIKISRSAIAIWARHYRINCLIILLYHGLTISIVVLLSAASTMLTNLSDAAYTILARLQIQK